MNCSEVRQLLSAFFDDELSDEVRCDLAKHLDACGACAKELSGTQNLSAMTGRLDTPDPPARIWSQIEKELYKPTAEPRGTGFQPAKNFWSLLQQAGNLPYTRLALATSAIVLIVLGWFGYRTWFEHGEHDGFTAEFGDYLEEFCRDPAAAQQFLLAKYEGQAVDTQQAVRQVGYRPAVADGLPEGYAVDSIYVMKMPCCTCVQCVCKRNDGGTIAIFEHDDEETTEWFGDRPQMSASCNGNRCSLVELNDHIAASWKHDKRHITVVGIRDVEELTELVAWLDEPKQIRPQ